MSKDDKRDAILERISEVLIKQNRNVIELEAVLDQSGVRTAELDAAFDDADDLLIALVRRFAKELSEPLRPRSEHDGDEFADLRGRLSEFGAGLENAYASLLIGFFRLAMTEGSRHKAIRGRLFDEGPGAVTAALSSFLERARAADRIRCDDCSLAAEQLMGMFREPLYQEISLHSTELINRDGQSSSVSPALDIFLRGYGRSEGARQ